MNATESYISFDMTNNKYMNDPFSHNFADMICKLVKSKNISKDDIRLSLEYGIELAEMKSREIQYNE